MTWLVHAAATVAAQAGGGGQGESHGVLADMASDPQHLTSANWEHIDRKDSCTRSTLAD